MERPPEADAPGRAATEALGSAEPRAGRAVEGSKGTRWARADRGIPRRAIPPEAAAAARGRARLADLLFTSDER